MVDVFTRKQQRPKIYVLNARVSLYYVLHLFIESNGLRNDDINREYHQFHLDQIKKKGYVLFNTNRPNSIDKISYLRYLLASRVVGSRL